MKKSFPPQSWSQSLRKAFLQPFGLVGPNPPENSLDRHRFTKISARAWSLFLGISGRDRIKLMVAYLLLAGAAFLKERTYFGGSWQNAWAWMIHLTISTWALSFFLFSRSQRKQWWIGLPGVVLFLLLLDILGQFFWTVNFYGAAFSGVMVGWVLGQISIPMVFGALSPDFLILILPVILFLILGLFFLWLLLGLTFVIPLMLDRGVGIGPAISSSLRAARGIRRHLLTLFIMVTVLVSLPCLLITIGKILVSVLPFAPLSPIPPSPGGVWICFGIQTLVLFFGTSLAIWIWPLGSALWAALYAERWNAGRSTFP